LLSDSQAKRRIGTVRTYACGGAGSSDEAGSFTLYSVEWFTKIKKGGIRMILKKDKKMEDGTIVKVISDSYFVENYTDWKTDMELDLENPACKLKSDQLYLGFIYRLYLPREKDTFDIFNFFILTEENTANKELEDIKMDLRYHIYKGYSLSYSVERALNLYETKIKASEVVKIPSEKEWIFFINPSDLLIETEDDERLYKSIINSLPVYSEITVGSNKFEMSILDELPIIKVSKII
jgi:hypothetical protein